MGQEKGNVNAKYKIASQKRPGRASDLLSFIFLQRIIQFQLFPILRISPPFLRNSSRWLLILLLSFGSDSLFLNCPWKGLGRRRRGGGRAFAPRVCLIQAVWEKRGGWGGTAAHAIPITLNVINLPDSWKSDMHELQRNLLFRHEMLLHNEKENVLCALINSDRSSTPKYFYLWHYLFRP